MKKNDIMPFLGKYVKLEFRTGFVINGNIVKVSDDAVFFRTEKMTSAVSLDNISLIVLKNRSG